MCSSMLESPFVWKQNVLFSFSMIFDNECKTGRTNMSTMQPKMLHEKFTGAKPAKVRSYSCNERDA